MDCTRQEPWGSHGVWSREGRTWSGPHTQKVPYGICVEMDCSRQCGSPCDPTKVWGSDWNRAFPAWVSHGLGYHEAQMIKEQNNFLHRKGEERHLGYQRGNCGVVA